MGYRDASPDRYGLLKAYARENRKNATLAESVLWEQLRGNIQGVKFLRQHVIGDYIVDFVSRSGGLIIEVDGGYHAEGNSRRMISIGSLFLNKKDITFFVSLTKKFSTKQKM